MPEPWMAALIAPEPGLPARALKLRVTVALGARVPSAQSIVEAEETHEAEPETRLSRVRFAGNCTLSWVLLEGLGPEFFALTVMLVASPRSTVWEPDVMLTSRSASSSVSKLKVRVLLVRSASPS